MKAYLFVFICSLLVSCNNETVREKVAAEPVKEQKPKEAVSDDDDVLTPVIGEIDMGDYIFRVHEIIQYHPDEMQSKMMKFNDAEKDYFLVDASIESKSDQALYTGKDILTAYFILSDGSMYKNAMNGAVILGSYTVGNKGRYSQAKYDQIWGHKFPARKKARTVLYGVAAPEGTTIKTIGFHQTNKEKNKFTDLK